MTDLGFDALCCLVDDAPGAAKKLVGLLAQPRVDVLSVGV